MGKEWCQHREFLSNALHSKIKMEFVCPWCQTPPSRPSEPKKCHPFQTPALNAFGMVPESCDTCGDTYWINPEPKKLADVLCDAWVKWRRGGGGGSRDYDYQAKAAKEWFLGVVESLPTMKDMGVEYYSKSELIKKLKEEGES